MKVVTFKIDDELLEKLELYAINRKLSRSDVIREAIQRFLREEEEKVVGEGFINVMNSVASVQGNQ